MKLFALDQNFPEPLVACVANFVQSAELVPLREINENLVDADDWEILIALHQHERPWDGLITNDDSMLNLEAEICMLVRTNLTLVVAEGQGHNPIRAAGVLLAHIDHICHQTKPDEAQLWQLRVSQKAADDPWHFLRKVAERKGVTPQEMMQRNPLPG